MHGAACTSAEQGPSRWADSEQGPEHAASWRPLLVLCEEGVLPLMLLPALQLWSPPRKADDEGSDGVALGGSACGKLAAAAWVGASKATHRM